MPQILLEYTANIPALLAEEFLYESILQEVHTILHTVGNITLNNCKSRVHRLDEYYIGDGTPEHAFVHLQISLLEGRSDELKKEMGTKILSFLQDYFTTLIPDFENKLHPQLSVHFVDIQRAHYFKYPPL